jgi:hypothetical protein
MLLLVLIAAKAGWAVSCALAAFRFARSASAFGLALFVLEGTFVVVMDAIGRTLTQPEPEATSARITVGDGAAAPGRDASAIGKAEPTGT